MFYKGPSNTSFWIQAAPGAVLSGMTPLIANLVDLTDHRRNVMLAGSILAIIGNLISGTSQSLTQLMVGGAFAGLGYACRVNGYSGILELVPKNRRPLVFCLVQTSLLPAGFGMVICELLL